MPALSQPDSPLEELTGAVIGAAMTVSNTLGHGFLEAVYQKALIYELRQQGITVQSSAAFRVYYKGQDVGCYHANLVVERSVIVELKAVQKLAPAHVGQVVNYLKASSLSMGLLFNFGSPVLEWRRVLL